MDVVISDSARDFLAEHGHVAYIRAHSHRCCSAGSLTLLKVETNAPSDAEHFSAFHVNDVDVRYLVGPLGAPSQLIIETRGRLRPHLVAFWDGCAFKP
jgi:hypothetical protein